MSTKVREEGGEDVGPGVISGVPLQTSESPGQTRLLLQDCSL